jgi:hypothetical protein
MSYVEITLRQRLSDAKAIRDYLLDAERQLPRNIPNAQMHIWLEHIAREIEDAAKPKAKVVALRPNKPEPPKPAA